MTANWYKCQGGLWCELRKLDVTHKLISGVKGVYVIWYGSGNTRTVLRVGGGDIETEVKANQKDTAIIAFSHLGLYISWAPVNQKDIDGVFSYLYEKLKPKYMKIIPKNTPIMIDLPWVV